MRARLILVPALVAILAGLIPVAGATAWTTNCSSSGQKVCIYRDDNYGLPLAAVNGNYDNYNDGSKYPNTNDNINDSANGAKNWYSSNDVIFYNDANDQGGSFCVNSLTGYQTIGFFNNDRWSSHQVFSSTAC